MIVHTVVCAVHNLWDPTQSLNNIHGHFIRPDIVNNIRDPQWYFWMFVRITGLLAADRCATRAFHLMTVRELYFLLSSETVPPIKGQTVGRTDGHRSVDLLAGRQLVGPCKQASEWAFAVDFSVKCHIPWDAHSLIWISVRNDRSTCSFCGLIDLINGLYSLSPPPSLNSCGARTYGAMYSLKKKILKYKVRTDKRHVRSCSRAAFYQQSRFQHPDIFYMFYFIRSLPLSDAPRCPCCWLDLHLHKTIQHLEKKVHCLLRCVFDNKLQHNVQNVLIKMSYIYKGHEYLL